MFSRIAANSRKVAWVASVSVLLFSIFGSDPAQALPAYARQTGQSCVACHAGGQFPELTPYGRMFKLTGYTMGQRDIPLSFMAIVDDTKTNKSHDSSGNALTTREGVPVFDFASVFVAGKVTDSIGLFSQFTYANYDHQTAEGDWRGHFGSDNFDLRFAQRSVSTDNDWIVGLTLNNNPSVQDVWNSSTAWGYPYAVPPGSLGYFGGGAAGTLLEGGVAGGVAGIGAYTYINKHWYAELTSYRTADGFFQFLSIGKHYGDIYSSLTELSSSNNPYLRFAYTNELGPYNYMLGFTQFNAGVYPSDATFRPVTTTGSTHYKDSMIDGQFQYLLDPHTVTAQFRYIHEHISDDTGTAYAGPVSLNNLQLKGTYVYQARYGGTLAYTRSTGDTDTIAYASSASYSPNTSFYTAEAFYTPIQNIRVGLQYTLYNEFLGSSSNYDGNGRNASDNNTLYLYFWTAF